MLSNLDVAFSRDQEKKIYVQHKLEKHGKEITEWLENGSYFYICGAREPMSIDVERSLIDIISLNSKRSKEEAASYIADLKEQGRFLKDVY